MRPRASGLRVHRREPDLGSGLQEPVTRLHGSRKRLLEERRRFGQSPAFQQRLPELDLELEPLLVAFLEERRGSLEKIACAVHVAAIERTPARSPQPRGGPCGEQLSGLTKLLPEAMRLLEVVAEQFIQFDEVGPVFGEPICEALMQLGPDRPSAVRRRPPHGSADGGSGRHPGRGAVPGRAE